MFVLSAFLLWFAGTQRTATRAKSETDAHRAPSQYLPPPLRTSAALCVRQHHPTDVRRLLSDFSPANSRHTDALETKQKRRANPNPLVAQQRERLRHLFLRPRRVLCDHSRHQTTGLLSLTSHVCKGRRGAFVFYVD